MPYNCTAVTVNWVLNNENNDPITGFSVYWKITSRNSWSVQDESSTIRAAVVSGLNSSSTYTLGIQANIQNINKNLYEFDVSTQFTTSTLTVIM